MADLCKSDLHQFLSPLDPESQHISIRDKLVHGTGDWLLNTTDFRIWRAGYGPPVFCCLGDPGVGKTFLACRVVEALRQSGDYITVSTYCNYQDRASYTARNIVGALLSQAIPYFESQKDIVEQLKERCRRNQPLSREGNTSLLCRFAASQLSVSPPICICIDALDELDIRELDNLLRSLSELLSRSTARIFFTCRRSAGAEESIDRLLKSSRPITTRYFSIPDYQTRLDIVRFLEQKLKEDRYSSLIDNELERTIFERLAGNSPMFLLAALKIEALLRKRTRRERRDSLNAVSLSLKDTYDKAIERIKNQDEDYGMRILHWVLFSTRPLALDELLCALAMRSEVTCLDPNDDVPPSSILDSTLGLVTVDRDSRGRDIVRFVHLTFKDHLLATSSLYFPTGHTMLAEATLAYLSSSVWINDHERLPFPMFQYATENWGHHARNREDSHIVAKVLLFLRSRNFSIMCCSQCHVLSSPVCKVYSSPLHVLSYFGLANTLQHLISLASNVGASPDLVSDACMHPDAHPVHTTSTSIPYTHQIDIGIPESEEKTPLLYAVEGGYITAVKLLLGLDDTEVNATRPNGITPLLHATKHGRLELVELLLGHAKILINTKDDFGRTPLSYASENRHLDIIHLLLRREDVDLNTLSTRGEIPLLYASENGHFDVVKLLLAHKNIDVNVTDGWGKMPLLCAVGKGHLDVVTLLLGHESIDVNGKANGSAWMSPLSCASKNGHFEVVELLLRQQDIQVSVNFVDGWGMTALSYASRGGHVNIVGLLLKQEAINPSMAGYGVFCRGETPLSAAVRKGHIDVVKLLLGHKNIEVNATSINGTPLMLAAEKGHLEIVKFLLMQKNIDLQTTNGGMTPLDCARHFGHREVAELLRRQSERVDTDTGTGENTSITTNVEFPPRKRRRFE